MVLSWKEHPALNQQTREWLCLFFRVLEVKVQPRWGFFHILSIWHRAGDRHRHTQSCTSTRREHVTGTTKALVSAFPHSHASRAFPVGGVGDGGLLARLALSPRLYFRECFKPALATKGSCPLVSHCSRLLASTLQLLCNHTEAHR